VAARRGRNQARINGSNHKCFVPLCVAAAVDICIAWLCLTEGVLAGCLCGIVTSSEAAEMARDVCNESTSAVLTIPLQSWEKPAGWAKYIVCGRDSAC